MLQTVWKLVDLHEPDDAKAKQVNVKPGGLKDMSVKQQREAMIRYLEHMPAELDPEIEQANEWARAVAMPEIQRIAAAEAPCSRRNGL